MTMLIILVIVWIIAEGDRTLEVLCAPCNLKPTAGCPSIEGGALRGGVWELQNRLGSLPQRCVYSGVPAACSPLFTKPMITWPTHAGLGLAQTASTADSECTALMPFMFERAAEVVDAARQTSSQAAHQLTGLMGTSNSLLHRLPDGTFSQRFRLVLLLLQGSYTAAVETPAYCLYTCRPQWLKNLHLGRICLVSTATLRVCRVRLLSPGHRVPEVVDKASVVARLRRRCQVRKLIADALRRTDLRMCSGSG